MSIAMDVAMYKAKRLGKNRVATIEASEKEVVAETFSQGELIKRAMDEDRVEIYLQPIMDMATGVPYAYEALARIREGEAIIAAGQFIDAADELGLSEPLDKRILEKGIALKKNCGKLDGIKLFFNLSPHTFCNYNFMRSIPALFESAGVALEDAVFEITEREALPHLGDLSVFINELRAAGMRFALDDFGSGFSSFIYLKYLTVDYIKIEGSFVKNIANDVSDRIMVSHISDMAHDFGVETIAEFVEDEPGAEIVRELNVNYGQGYHLGKPMSAKALMEKMEQEG